jgi:hypothetical protein
VARGRAAFHTKGDTTQRGKQGDLLDDQNLRRRLAVAVTSRRGRGFADRLADKRAFLHQIRSEEGFVQLFIGWFFDGQSGDLSPYTLLARAPEMEIDLAFDIYPDFDAHETTNRPDRLQL